MYVLGAVCLVSGLCFAARAAKPNGQFLASLPQHRQDAILSGESAAPDKGELGGSVQIIACALASRGWGVDCGCLFRGLTIDGSLPNSVCVCFGSIMHSFDKHIVRSDSLISMSWIVSGDH